MAKNPILGRSLTTLNNQVKIDSFTLMVRKNWAIILILIIAVFLRFYNYQSRLITSTDQSRDAILALEAIRSHRIPLLGPPSSAWGFNFGPLYYYFVILFTLLIPSNLGPWIGFSLLSVFTVYLYFRIGEQVQGKQLGLLMAAIAAMSFGDIQNSVNMLNTALVSFATVLSFYCIAQILKKISAKYAIVLGFSVALAVNSHLQSLPLLVVIPLLIFFTKGKTNQKITSLLSICLGFIIAFIPLLYFESQHYFAWTKSIIDYAINGQKKFYTPVRWLTEFTTFWPGVFGNVIFGVPKLGYLLFALLGTSVVVTIVKKVKVQPFFIILFITFLAEIISVRYYKGPRSVEYFILAMPLVIMTVSWAMSIIYHIQKIVFYILAAGWLCLSVYSTRNAFSFATQTPKTLDTYSFVAKTYPNGVELKTFSYSDEGARFLYYLLMKNNLINPKGPILVICDLRESLGKPVEYCPQKGRIYNKNRFVLYESEDPAKDFTGYEIQDISSDILFKRNYNNYELIKF